MSRNWKFDSRVYRILEILTRLGSGSLDARVSISPKNDELDAISTGINMLTEELSDRTCKLLKEKQLHAEDAKKMRAILNATTDLALLVDVDGTVLDINENAARMLGDSNTALIGRMIIDVLPERFKDVLSLKILDVVSTGCEASFEYDAFGTLFDIRIFPIVDEMKGVASAAIFCRDISKQKQMEQQLFQSQKLEAVGQLASGIAHEINTPIQFVGDNIQYLKFAFDEMRQLLASYKENLEALIPSSDETALRATLTEAEECADLEYMEDALPEAFAAVQEGIRRVADIVKAMKEFSHPDCTGQTPSDLNRALTNTLTIARNEYKYVAEVETKLGVLPAVVCHVGDVSQVFLNLIVNAAHAIEDVVGDTGEKGLIRIESRNEGDAVMFSFSDTGNGIPSSIRDRIFDPFFTTKEVGRGSGQGLAIVHTIIVEKHNGTISFESEIGKGTTFFIGLPINGRESDEEEE